MYLQKKQKKNFSLKGRFRKKKRLLRYLDFVEFYLMDNPVGVRVGSTIVQVFMALKCIEDWGMDYEMKWGRLLPGKGLHFIFIFLFFFLNPGPGYFLGLGMFYILWQYWNVFFLLIYAFLIDLYALIELECWCLWIL